jgi:hypothetical protein
VVEARQRRRERCRLGVATRRREIRQADREREVPRLKELEAVPEPHLEVASARPGRELHLHLGPAPLLRRHHLVLHAVDLAAARRPHHPARLHSPARPLEAGPVHAHEQPSVRIAPASGPGQALDAAVASRVSETYSEVWSDSASSDGLLSGSCLDVSASAAGRRTNPPRDESHNKSLSTCHARCIADACSYGSTVPPSA